MVHTCMIDELFLFSIANSIALSTAFLCFTQSYEFGLNLCVITNGFLNYEFQLVGLFLTKAIWAEGASIFRKKTDLNVSSPRHQNPSPRCYSKNRTTVFDGWPELGQGGSRKKRRIDTKLMVLAERKLTPAAARALTRQPPDPNFDLLYLSSLFSLFDLLFFSFDGCLLVTFSYTVYLIVL